VRAWFGATRVVLVISALLVAAVPALRREVVWGLALFGRALRHWPDSAYARYLSGETVFITPTQQDTEAALRAHPRDLQLLIGLVAPTDGSYRTPVARQALSRALRLAPHDPVALSVAALRELRDPGALTYSREQETTVRGATPLRAPTPAPRPRG
jgi:hypothetical protein